MSGAARGSLYKQKIVLLCVWAILLVWAFLSGRYQNELWFAELGAARSLIVLVSLSVVVWAFAGQKKAIAPELSSLLFMLAFASDIRFSLQEQVRPQEFGFYQWSMLWMILVALFYRGSGILWTLVFLPMSFVMLAVPILYASDLPYFYFSSSVPVQTILDSFVTYLHAHRPSVVNLAAPPIFAIVFAQIIVLIKLSGQRRFRDHMRLAAVQQMQSELRNEVKRLEAMVGDLSWKTQASIGSAVPVSNVQSSTALEGYVAQPEKISITKFRDDLSELLHSYRRGLILKSNKVKIDLEVPHQTSLPLEVQIDWSLFSKLFLRLLDQSVASLGGGAGFVKVTMLLGHRRVKLVFEDNGRGLSKELYTKLEERGFLQTLHSTRSSERELEAMAAKLGIVFSHSSRLGVGSRVELELPTHLYSVQNSFLKADLSAKSSNQGAHISSAVDANS